MSDNIITAATVHLDVDAGSDPAAVITYLAENLGEAGRTTDPSELSRAALAREAKSATGLPGGIAIPHARAASVTTAVTRNNSDPSMLRFRVVDSTWPAS